MRAKGSLTCAPQIYITGTNTAETKGTNLSLKIPVIVLPRHIPYTCQKYKIISIKPPEDTFVTNWMTKEIITEII